MPFLRSCPIPQQLPILPASLYRRFDRFKSTRAVRNLKMSARVLVGIIPRRLRRTKAFKLLHSLLRKNPNPASSQVSPPESVDEEYSLDSEALEERLLEVQAFLDTKPEKNNVLNGLELWGGHRDDFWSDRERGVAEALQEALHGGDDLSEDESFYEYLRGRYGDWGEAASFHTADSGSDDKEEVVIEGTQDVEEEQT